METATLVKKMDGGTGDMRLFKLSRPIEYDKPWDDNDPPAKKTEFVIVSATVAMFCGPETYVFPSNKNGEIVDWGELDGSYRGGLSHSEALRGAGFEIKET